MAFCYNSPKWLRQTPEWQIWHNTFEGNCANIPDVYGCKGHYYYYHYCYNYYYVFMDQVLYCGSFQKHGLIHPHPQLYEKKFKFPFCRYEHWGSSMSSISSQVVRPERWMITHTSNLWNSWIQTVGICDPTLAPVNSLSTAVWDDTGLFLWYSFSFVGSSLFSRCSSVSLWNTDS